MWPGQPRACHPGAEARRGVAAVEGRLLPAHRGVPAPAQGGGRGRAARQGEPSVALAHALPSKPARPARLACLQAAPSPAVYVAAPSCSPAPSLRRPSWRSWRSCKAPRPSTSGWPSSCSSASATAACRGVRRAGPGSERRRRRPAHGLLVVTRAPPHCLGRHPQHPQRLPCPPRPASRPRSPGGAAVGAAGRRSGGAGGARARARRLPPLPAPLPGVPGRPLTLPGAPCCCWLAVILACRCAWVTSPAARQAGVQRPPAACAPPSRCCVAACSHSVAAAAAASTERARPPAPLQQLRRSAAPAPAPQVHTQPAGERDWAQCRHFYWLASRIHPAGGRLFSVCYLRVALLEVTALFLAGLAHHPAGGRHLSVPAECTHGL